jgi:hypothetical protein
MTRLSIVPVALSAAARAFYFGVQFYGYRFAG